MNEIVFISGKHLSLIMSFILCERQYKQHNGRKLRFDRSFIFVVVRKFNFPTLTNTKATQRDLFVCSMSFIFVFFFFCVLLLPMVFFNTLLQPLRCYSHFENNAISYTPIIVQFMTNALNNLEIEISLNIVLIVFCVCV